MRRSFYDPRFAGIYQQLKIYLHFYPIKDMASISMNTVSSSGTTSTPITGGEKFIVLDSTGKFVTVGVNSILDRVDEGIVDRIDDQILEIVEDQIDEIIDEHLENLDPIESNLKWNEVYD